MSTGILNVAGTLNHRIVSYDSAVTVVVAGGNGAGALTTQLRTASPLELIKDHDYKTNKKTSAFKES